MNMKPCIAKPLAVCVLSMLPIVSMAGNPSSVGDIVGRDLNILGLGWAGHVGMWNGSNVVEVLSKSPVIQQNSLSNFKSQSKYWGARYGKGSNFYGMVSSGWNQRLYSPSYTITASWKEGGLQERYCAKYNWWGTCASYAYRTTTAQFRCDTFTNYMYWKGAGSSLVGNSILPTIVYNSMPKSR